MKVLIFSDTHLTYFFDQRKYSFLESLIKEADKVLINGDFWDGFLISFDSFINTQWRGLFPLLKSKNSIYIYGNHDPIRKINSKFEIFADQLLESYTLQVGDNKLFLEHGNKYAKDLTEIIDFPYPIENIVTAALGLSVGIESTGNRIAKWDFHKNAFPYYYKYLNKRMKEASIKERDESSTYIVHGHSHFPEIDNENRYINTGCIKGGVASFLWVEDDSIELIKSSYGDNVEIILANSSSNSSLA